MMRAIQLTESGLDEQFEEVDCPLCNSKKRDLYFEHDDDPYLNQLKVPKDFKVSFYYCDDCELIYQSPRWTKKTADRFYSKLYRPQVPQQKNVDYKLKDAADVYDFIHEDKVFPKSGRMLDVGTGEGLLPYTHEKMGENGGPKWDTYAIEPNKVYADWARANKLCQVETGEFKKKSWRNLTFDLITAQQVLEHIHDPVAFLKLCNDRLYSDGWLYIGVPTVEYPWGNEYSRFNMMCDNFTASPRLTLYTPRTLGRMLNKAGFYLERLDYYSRGIRSLSRKLRPGETQEHYGRENRKRIEETFKNCCALERQHLAKQQESVSSEGDSQEDKGMEVPAVSNQMA